jgi:hypothetical protein
VHTVSRRLTSSSTNYPEIRIINGVPKVYIGHSSNYTVTATVEAYNGGNDGSTYTVFGLDSGLTNINGNVGIGTTSPSAKLDVNGDIYKKGHDIFT